MQAGDVFTVAYPFLRSTFEHQEMDVDGPINSTRPTWRPGTEYTSEAVYVGHGEYDERVENVADAMGQMVLTVVSVHKPGRYPTRVFFTRQFVTPEGKAFGKTMLRMMTLAAFTRRTRGYLVPFVLRPVSEPIAK